MPWDHAGRSGRPALAAALLCAAPRDRRGGGSVWEGDTVWFAGTSVGGAGVVLLCSASFWVGELAVAGASGGVVLSAGASVDKVWGVSPRAVSSLGAVEGASSCPPLF